MGERIAGRRVLTPEGIIGPAAVVVEGGIIRAITPVDLAPDVTIAPGFVDLQVNGIDDVDVATADDAGWERLDRLVAAGGVTTWLPTLPTLAADRYPDAIAGIAAAALRPGPRPSIAGAHLEGPFLAAAGAHAPELLREIDLGWLAGLPAVVRLVTLAPEHPEAVSAIELLAQRGVLVSLGHSRATPAEVRAAIEAGASMATHLFNVMGPISSRAPGIAGAVLVDDRLTAGLIGDLVHVDVDLVRLAFRAKPGRIALVSDAAAWRGRPGRTFDGQVPRLPDGTIAGATATLDRAVANVVLEAGIDLVEALHAASTIPARLLGLDDRGTIEVGKRADLVVLDPTLQATETWSAGTRLPT